MTTMIQDNSAPDLPIKLRFIFWFNFILRHFFPKNAFLLEQQKELQQSFKGGDHRGPRFVPVERRENLSEDEFIRLYLNRSVPVIFSGQALTWPCTRKWGFPFLENELKDFEFTLFDSPGLIERRFRPETAGDRPVIIEKIKAADLAKAVKNGDKKYVRFSTIMDDMKSLIDDLDTAWLKTMRRSLFGVCYQNFIGGAGRITPFHAESTSLFYVMADGEKKWSLVRPESTPLMNPGCDRHAYLGSDLDFSQPDEAAYPGLKRITCFEAHLKKGDILFVPAWHWHQVENLTDSWGVSYSFSCFRNFARYPGQVIVRSFLSKPSFWANLAEGLFSRKIKSHESDFASPRIFRD